MFERNKSQPIEPFVFFVGLANSSCIEKDFANRNSVEVDLSVVVESPCAMASNISQNESTHELQHEVESFAWRGKRQLFHRMVFCWILIRWWIGRCKHFVLRRFVVQHERKSLLETGIYHSPRSASMRSKLIDEGVMNNWARSM